MKFDTFINILTPRPLNSQEDGRDFLQLWVDVFPECAPEAFGNWEPLKARFDSGDLDLVVKSWSWPFMVKRHDPPMQGCVFMNMGGQPKHAWVSISLSSKQLAQSTTLRFLQAAAVRLKADFAFLHLLTAPDVKYGMQCGTVQQLDSKGTRFNLSVTTQDLLGGLPDLYWATIFGPAYIRLFGRETILSAPAPFVRELSEDALYLQLSEQIGDLKTHHAEVHAVKERVKSHLNKNAFFDPESSAAHQYSTPHFLWEK